MGHVAIVTDSTADLAPDVAAAAGIRVVPLYVRFGDEEYQAGVDLSTDEFWTRMLAPGAAIPSTAAPSPGTFKERSMPASPTAPTRSSAPLIGSKLSATFQSRRRSPPRCCPTARSTSSTRAPRPCRPASRRCSRPRWPRPAPGRRDRDRRPRSPPDIDLYVAVDTLDYLRKGGRLSPAQAAIGALLSVKPIITVRDGTCHVRRAAADPRQGSRARRRTRHRASHRAPRDPPHAHQHARGGRGVPGRDRRTCSRRHRPGAVSIGLLGASTGPHLGPGLMGAAFLRRH